MARTPSPKDPQLLSKVSRLYYEQELSEAEIANRLHLSRPKVSRLLKEARKAGIVQIHITPPPGIYTELENELEQRFGLREAIVVDVGEPYYDESVTRSLGAVAARHLQETLRVGDTIGVSWGSTLNAMVAAIRPQRSTNTRVVQLIGGLGHPTAEVHASELCRRMANALQAELIPLPVPGIMHSVQAKEAVLSDSHIQRALSLFEKVNVAYVGIGSPTPDSVMMRDGTIMSPEDLAELQEQGAVGDIALRFFDAQGRPVQSDLNERVIGIQLDQLQKIQRVVGVSGGLKKFDAVRGALLGKFVNILITDRKLAEALLSSPASEITQQKKITETNS